MRIGDDIAHTLNDAKPLVESKSARILPGRGGQETVEWPYGGKFKSYPRKYKNAGVRIEDGQIIVENSRGVVVFTHALTESDYQARNATDRAFQILRCWHGGEYGQLFVRYASTDGELLVDHPTLPTNCYLKMTDAGRPVPVETKYCRGLRKRETEADRIVSAIAAWTAARLDKCTMAY